MNPRLVMAVVLGVLVTILVYVLEVVTPPPALFYVDFLTALGLGSAVSLITFFLRF